MPLADSVRGVAGLLEQGGQQRVAGGEPGGLQALQYSKPLAPDQLYLVPLDGPALSARPPGVAARQQRGAARGTLRTVILEYSTRELLIGFGCTDVALPWDVRSVCPAPRPPWRAGPGSPPASPGCSRARHSNL